MAGQLSRRGWCRLPSSSLLHSATLGKRVFTTLHGSAVSPSAVSPRHLRRTGWLKPAAFRHFLQASRARSMGDRASSSLGPVLTSTFFGRTADEALRCICLSADDKSRIRSGVEKISDYQLPPSSSARLKSDDEWTTTPQGQLCLSKPHRGDIISMWDLKTRGGASLNGEVCFLERFLKKKNRWQVKHPRRTKPFLARPENIFCHKWLKQGGLGDFIEDYTEEGVISIPPTAIRVAEPSQLLLRVSLHNTDYVLALQEPTIDERQRLAFAKIMLLNQLYPDIVELVLTGVRLPCKVRCITPGGCKEMSSGSSDMLGKASRTRVAMYGSAATQMSFSKSFIDELKQAAGKKGGKRQRHVE